MNHSSPSIEEHIHVTSLANTRSEPSQLHQSHLSIVKKSCRTHTPLAYLVTSFLGTCYTHYLIGNQKNKNHTWDIIFLHTSKKPIRCEWVYKVKLKANGSIERLMARLGCTQVYWIYYKDTFFLVVKITSIRYILIVVIHT